ncbi:MAG: beta-N-acetylhexosaminidase [Alphaproteobacteria bacterium]
MNPNFATSADNASAAIFSIAGLQLSKDEIELFKKSPPLGFILFARNCENPAQLKSLNEQLKNIVGRDCPILIDQEGGRVQRLRPPHWRALPPMKQFGDAALEDKDHALEDLRFTILQMAEDLLGCGINVNCTPVLDVLTAKTHDVIGDRAFSGNPAVVSRLGLSVCRSLLAAGITPIIKHIPGHGRGTLDSHFDLPVVDTVAAELSKTDFLPFRDIASSDVGPYLWAMTAHIIYSAIDPDLPATLSPRMIDIIRREIGFDGILLTDDVDMKALKTYGDVTTRCRDSLEAGCDLVLYCAGNMGDMRKIAESVPKMTVKTLERLQKSGEFSRVAA